VDGKALISKSIKIPSGCTLELMPNCGLFLASNANCIPVINYHRSGTSKGDTNISIIGGGYINGNYANNSKYETNSPTFTTTNGSSQPWNNGLMLLGVDGFKVDGIHITNSQNFAFMFGNCNNGQIQNCSADWDSGAANQDSYHFWGPSTNVFGLNNSAGGFDSAIGLCGDELVTIGYPQTGPLPMSMITNSTNSQYLSSGNLCQIHFNGLQLKSNCCAGVLMFTTTYHDLAVDNVYGSLTTNGASYALEWQGGDTNSSGFSACNWNVSGSGFVGFTTGYATGVRMSGWLNTNYIPSHDQYSTNKAWMDLGNTFLQNCTFSDFSITTTNANNDLIYDSGINYNNSVSGTVLSNIKEKGFNSVFNANSQAAVSTIQFNDLFIDSGAQFIGLSNIGTIPKLAASQSDTLGGKVGSSYFTSSNSTAMQAFVAGMYARFGADQVECIYDFQPNHQSTNGTVLYGLNGNASVTGTFTTNSSGIVFVTNSTALTANTLLLGPITTHSSGPVNTGLNTTFSMFIVCAKPLVATNYMIPVCLGSNVLNQNVTFAVPNGDPNTFAVGSDEGFGARVSIAGVSGGSNFFSCANISRYNETISLNNGTLGGTTGDGEATLANNAVTFGNDNGVYPWTNTISIFGIVKHQITSADSQYIYALIKSTIGSGLSLP
jgi:hypothetical protein